MMLSLQGFVFENQTTGLYDSIIDLLEEFKTSNIISQPLRSVFEASHYAASALPNF